MRASSSHWYEAWHIKMLAIALGACIIYLGQTRYEQGLKRDELRQAGNPQEDSGKPRFDLLAQIDLAGESEVDQLREMESVASGMHFLENIRSLTDVRGLICIALPQTLSGRVLSSSEENVGGLPTWTFEIASRSSSHVKTVPLSLPAEGIICLRVPYTTASGIDPAELWIKKDGAMVAKLPLKPFRPVRAKNLGTQSSAPPIVVSQPATESFTPDFGKSMWSPKFSVTSKYVQYHIRLKTPVPAGQTAFVCLMTTEYAPGVSEDGWTQFKDSEAYVTSPCGLLAKRAELRVIFGTPKTAEKTVVAPLGNIVVQFGQPTFIVKSPEAIPVSPNTSIELRPQGPVFKRPPHHPNLAIHVYADVPKLWSVRTQTFPDLVQHVDWVAPSPASLGLDSIWLPWGKVLASTRPADSVQQGPLKATLRVRMTSLQVTRNVTAVVPIEREQ